MFHSSIYTEWGISNRTVNNNKQYKFIIKDINLSQLTLLILPNPVYIYEDH